MKENVLEVVKRWYYEQSPKAQFYIAVSIGAFFTGGSTGLAKWIGIINLTLGGS